MFKKNITVAQTRPLSGKDSKQLRRDVQVQFPDISEEELKELLPTKSEVAVMKLSNKAQAYSVDGIMLFFDPEGRGDLLVPTVYALWKLPSMVQAVQTYSEVSPKVLGGADLFLQGFILPESGLPQFEAGDLMAITIPGNRYPFAVGMMETSSAAVAKSGLKGKGVKLLHHFPDQLWTLGDKSVPDPSFTPLRIFPQELGNGSAPQPEEQQSSAAETGVSGLSLDEKPAQEEGAPDEQPANAAHDPADAPELGTQPLGANGAVMGQDELAEHCLLCGLQSLQDAELPIMTSDFYSKHMLPAKPPGATMDIKKSSYKKLSKLLQKYEKKGLLAQKVIHKQDHISTVNRSHELYSAAGVSQAAGLSNGTEQRGGPDAAKASTSGSSPEPSARLDVSYCYRVPTSLRPIFAATPAAKDDLYSEAQVRAALQQYAAANALASEGAAAVKLDRLLHGNLFNKKEAFQEGDPDAAEDLVKRLLGKLQLYHHVVRISEQGSLVEVVNKGTIKNISIQTEDRQGGRKHITKLAHIESFGLNPDEFSGVLQRKFQTSSSVQKLPGKNETGKEISLQGDVLKELAAFLTDAYGIDAQYISAVSKAKSAK